MIEADAIQFTAAKKSNLLFPAEQIFRRCCAECGEPLIKKPKSQRFCSLKCSQIRTVQKIADSRRGKHQREGTKECGTCHALIGMSGAMSGRLLAASETTIHFLRKRNSLPTLSGSQAAKSAYIRSDAGAKKIEQQNSDAWWEENWGGVVETYWEKTVHLAAAIHPARGLTDAAYMYHWDIERRRANCAEKAKHRYHNLKHTPLFKIKKIMRNQIKRALRRVGYRKKARTPEYFGCSIEDMAAYIEAQFHSGMAWSNHGKVWELDHITPMSKFNLLDPYQMRLCNHYTNLRPMLKTQNRMKGDSMVAGQTLLPIGMTPLLGGIP
jgi:hypothetical protein